MNINKAIECLEKLKNEHQDSEVNEAIDIAVKTIKDKNNIIQRILHKIKILYENESSEVEKLPKDLDYHLWVRRGLVLARQVVEKELEDKQNTN